MKIYVFLTFGIFSIGGGQCYVAAKAKYLETTGWKVFVFSNGFSHSKKCPISYLDKYLDSVLCELSYPPCYMPSFFVDSTIKKIEKKLGRISADSEIIIESHNSQMGMWGELLAQHINGRHFVVGMNEHYRGRNCYYEDKIDFYYFKFKRGELFASLNVAERLFDGYYSISADQIRRWIIDEDPVQDYDNETVNLIKRQDWNICYIGRGEKGYVQNVITGVGEFAVKHPDKKIQFINVGSAGKIHKKLINEILLLNSNLTFFDAGNQTPLPKSLFSKSDVIIAGSGSARCAVEEGALTLVIDTETNMCNGLLGYETMDSIFSSEQDVKSSVADALERILVAKVHLRLDNNYPPKKGVKACTMQNFEMIEKAVNDGCFYDEWLLRKGEIRWNLYLGYLAKKIKYKIL